MKIKLTFLALTSTFVLAGCGTEALHEREGLNVDMLNQEQESLLKSKKPAPEKINVNTLNETQEKLNRSNKPSTTQEAPSVNWAAFNQAQEEK